jgi:L-ascorbate 6-phosphate lactonase
MKLTWLGQAGCLIAADQDGGPTLLIDPWFSDHPDRTYRPSMPPLPVRIDGALATHGHLDHLDPASLVMVQHATELGCIVVPALHRADVVRDLGDVPVIGVQPGDHLAELGVDVVRAWHGVEVADGYTDGLGSGHPTPHVGYVIEVDGFRIYHSGDSLAPAELAAELAMFSPSVVFLPINGRDAESEARGIVGNMTAEEAVDFAIAVGATTLVAIHFDAFRGNTVDPEIVRDAAVGRALKVIIPVRGETIAITP